MNIESFSELQGYSFAQKAYSETWDNSFLGEITDNVIEHEGSNYFRSGDIQFKYTKITVEKFTNIVDLATDIVKGIFYLPSNGAHIGVIQKEIIEDDGSEIRTRCRYLIRPVIQGDIIPLSKITPSMLTSTELELVRKMFIFAWIMRFNSISEQTILIRKIHDVHIPLCWPNQEFGGGCSISYDTLKKWFADNKTLDSKTLDHIFNTAVQVYLKPYHSPLILRYKMDKLLHSYLGEIEKIKKVEIDTWLNEVVKNLTPAPAKEAVKEPRKI
jgi:hypothetical protein